MMKDKSLTNCFGWTDLEKVVERGRVALGSPEKKNMVCVCVVFIFISNFFFFFFFFLPEMWSKIHTSGGICGGIWGNVHLLLSLHSL